MNTLYGVPLSPFVRKVRLMLEHKGIPYKLKPVMPGDDSSEYRKISPLGKIPALVDDYGTLCDSSVICDYIEHRYPSSALYPEDPYERARALWFEEYSDTALFVPLVAGIFFQKLVGPLFFGKATDAALLKQAQGVEFPKVCEYLESQLKPEASYFVGDSYTIADIAIVCPFINAHYAGCDVDEEAYPRLARFVKAQMAGTKIAAFIAEERQMLVK